MPRGCSKSMAIPYKLRRISFHTCRLNGLRKDSADRDIRPTNFVASCPSTNYMNSVPAFWKCCVNLWKSKSSPSTAPGVTSHIDFGFLFDCIMFTLLVYCNLASFTITTRSSLNSCGMKAVLLLEHAISYSKWNRF